MWKKILFDFLLNHRFSSIKVQVASRLPQSFLTLTTKEIKKAIGYLHFKEMMAMSWEAKCPCSLLFYFHNLQKSWKLNPARLSSTNITEQRASRIKDQYFWSELCLQLLFSDVRSYFKRYLGWWNIIEYNIKSFSIWGMSILWWGVPWEQPSEVRLNLAWDVC